MDTASVTNYTALAEDIANWLRGHLDGSGAERFVLGLSGGIDSSTVCGLCCRAAGPERVLGAIMPSHSNPTDAEHAALVAQTFGVATVHIDLSPVTNAFLAAMPNASHSNTGVVGEPRDEARAKLADANVRPRLRMTTLYYLANLRGGIVVGTGNKSEAMIGYYTKYGDGGVDLLPLLDLYKFEVRALARELGVPELIITKPPSAGLWQGQTDEAEIGVTYDQLDEALVAIERDQTVGIDPSVLDRVQRLHSTSEHKRRPIPSFKR